LEQIEDRLLKCERGLRECENGNFTESGSWTGTPFVGTRNKAFNFGQINPFGLVNKQIAARNENVLQNLEN
jgi:hypothetical protein